MGFFGLEWNKKPGPEPTQARETLKGAPRDAAKLEQIRNFLLLSGGNFAPLEADFRNP
jgi:hypothetical protein